MLTIETTRTILDPAAARKAAKAAKIHARTGETLAHFEDGDPRTLFGWKGTAEEKAHDLIRWHRTAPKTFALAVEELQRRGKAEKVLREVRRIEAEKAA